MKKRDLLFAGLLFMGVSAFAQNGPDLTDPRSAEVIFTQDFEADWDAWVSEKIDSIKVLEYYDHEGNSNFAAWSSWSNPNLNRDNVPAFNPDAWKRGIFRYDSTIILYNGIAPTDNADEIKNNNFPNEDYQTEQETSAERATAMSNFGEDGGQYILRYTSDTCTLAENQYGNYKGGYTANYRRNLFVRGLPIEDTTSYRLTFYVKANRVPGHNREESEPRMSAGVFRGYYQSEKPFSMGILPNSSSDASRKYSYNAQFEYTIQGFTGDWQKVTLMTYYINDSIADNFEFIDGYWWADGAWTWVKKDSLGSVNPKDYDLNYLVQPDKFFVRLGFVSDYTEFQIDNLSLTKSWIGGCEYYNDKMRVDMGYKTNLGKLAADALEKNKIDAVEVVNTNNKYCEVWGYKDGKWNVVPIASIEYHGDGYMYMFTPSVTLPNGTVQKVKFGDYSEVRVTFHNPVDQPELALKYTGDGTSAEQGFPRALDTIWIQNGKIVPDFINELATPNPNIFDGVYSMKELPPVMQRANIEEGSFGLDPKTRELKFKFSRQVDLDALGEESKKVIAYVGEEVWTPTWSDNDTMLVITRPNNYQTDLAGDVLVELVQVYGLGTKMGDDVKVNYHFGDFVRKFNAQAVAASNWRSEVTVSTWDRPMVPSLWCYDEEDGFYTGTGENFSPYKKCGLYKMTDDGKNGDAFFYLAGRKSGKIASLYTVEALTKGNYSISFSAFGWGANIPTKVYVYAKPNEMSKDALAGVAEKTLIKEFTTSYQTSWSGNADEHQWNASVEKFEFLFNVPADGNYVIEWAVPRRQSEGQSFMGIAIGNYSISTAGDLSYGSTNALNASVDAAKALLDVVAKDNDALALYSCGYLTDLQTKYAFYNYDPEGGFKPYPTAPSKWAAAKKILDDATSVMKLRKDTVDAFVTQRQAVTDKLASEKAAYAGLDVYGALQAVETEALAFDPTTKTGDSIYKYNAVMKAAIETLDKRIALNKNLSNELARAKKLLADSVKTNYEEYAALKAVYNRYEKFDAINAADADVTATYDAVNAAANAYDFRVIGFQAKTVRIKALDKLATELGSDIVDNDDVKAAFEALEDDDDNLAAIYTEAIKLAIYQALTANPEAYDNDSLDITPFIKNYNLYQTPVVVERTDKKMPANAGDLSKPDTINGVPANMQHVQHEYNGGDLNGKMPIWVMILDRDYTNLYPGWTVKSIGANGGNRMVTGDQSYDAYVKGMPVFDAEIGMDWNGTAEMKQTLTDLPAGYYTLGVQIVEGKFSGSDKIATLSVELPDSTYTGKATESKAQDLVIDSIYVQDGNLPIYFMLRSENGWSRADNFKLAFRPDKDVEYDELISDQEAKIDQLLTVVDAFKAQADNVEFFNLGGQKIDAPKAGQILIRKTTNAKGRVVVDKVLLK